MQRRVAASILLSLCYGSPVHDGCCALSLYRHIVTDVTCWGQAQRALSSPGDRRTVRGKAGSAAANLEAEQLSSKAFLPDPR